MEEKRFSYYFSLRYYVFHTYKGYYRNIFSITTAGVDYGGEKKSTKYTYLGQFSNIVFEIENITLDDAGYYNGGRLDEAARSAEGAVLIVSGILPSPSALIQTSLFKLWGFSERLTGSYVVKKLETLEVNYINKSRRSLRATRGFSVERTIK